MGLISKVINYLVTIRNNANVNDVTIQTGGNFNITAEQYNDAGSFSQPLTTDYAVAVRDSGTGRMIVVGFVDPLNENEANAGDSGIYGRNAAGTVVCRVFCRSDGSVEINNANGFFLLEPNGVFTINGVTIDTNGNLTSPATVTAVSAVATNVTAESSMLIAGKELANHTHPAGTVPGNTGVNN